MSTKQQSLKDQKAELFSIQGNQGSLTQYKLPQGIISVENLIPAPVQAMIAAQLKSVGLNFDISKLALNKDNRELLKELKATVDLISNNAKLLPQFAVELKRAMKAATKMAEFNADLVKAALKEQANIDSAQVDILLALTGYQSKRNKLEMKLERRQKMLAHVQQARSRYYETTWGKEAQYIDAVWNDVTEVAIAQIDSRKEIATKDKERKLANQTWLKDAK